MARRRRARNKRGILGLLLGTRWGRRLTAGFNVLLLGAGVVWYAMQPPGRQAEIRLLVGNYFEQNKDIDLTELVFDLYTYYYGSEFIASDYEAGETALFGGVPETAGLSHSVRVLKNEGYLCGYSDTLRTPVWVAYRLYDLASETSAGERPRGFDVDSRTFAKVATGEFTGSGYDRGHLAPNYGIARCYGRDAQLETFLMSNIVPQKHEMNAGLWRYLEERAATNYTGRFGEVWVITGPVFSAEPKKIGKGVPIPDACFKIFLDETEGKIRAQAFVVPQDATLDQGLNRYLVSVDRVESLTGLDFLPDLVDSVESALESESGPRPW